MKNYELIKKQSDKSDSDLYFFKSKDKMIPLNSRISPKKEMIRFLEKNISKKNKILFIIGAGNGEIINVLTSLYNDIPRIIIIEPFDEIILESHIVEKISQSKNIEFFYSKGLLPVTVTSIIEEFRGLESQIVIHPKYEETDTKAISNILKTVEQSLRLFVINNNTINFFKKSWIVEPILNLPFTYEMNSIDSLQKKFKNCSAILVSSGPSLNESIEFIRQASNHSYIFCVGSALRNLIKNGITPDFVVSMDSSLRNYEAHFKGINYKGIMIFDTMTHHLIVENHKGSAFKMLSNVDGITGYLFPELEKFQSVASVAISTLNLIGWLGFEETYLVGQDLSYIDNSYYAEGITIHEGVTVDEEIFVDSNDGGKVATSETLNLQLSSFEQLANLLKSDMKMYNTSKKGAKIKNIPYNDTQRLEYQKFSKTIQIPLKENTRSLVGQIKAEKVINDLYEILETIKNEEKKIKRLHNEVVNVSDIKILLKSVKKLRTEPLIESAILNQLVDDVQRISNSFQYNFEDQTNNKQRKEIRDNIYELFIKIKDYIKMIIEDSDIQKIYIKR